MDAHGVVIEELKLPETVGSTDAGAFLEFSALTDALVIETWGSLDRATPITQRLASWKPNEYWELKFCFVRVQGQMVARAWIMFSLQDNLDSCYLQVDVLQAFQGRGLGKMLLDHVEAVAEQRGRHVLMGSSGHQATFDPDADGLLSASTGSGGLPKNSRAVRFALTSGYRLEQPERVSALEFGSGAEALWDQLEADALAIVGDSFELLHWVDECPEEFVDQMAVLMSKMSTDAPAGGVQLEAELWDAQRVRRVEQVAKGGGVTSLVSAARHVATGELAAYTVLEISSEAPNVAKQDDTLVAAGYRGNRLGVLVKLLNLRRLRANYPRVVQIVTENAAENSYMLNINIALGFCPSGYSGEWQKVVEQAREQ
ncbi:GNAT family N-acetyltransferase [Pseudarthrobacter sp. J1738]|uniref:GNAT family N-acetyltransferase n=1 Tax=unclassified Pseudarthrobacter TaxID=2647000 RepID=UPI003D2A0DF0